MAANNPTAAPRAKRTDDPVAPDVLRADVDAAIDEILAGGVAIIPTCLTYAIVGHRAKAIEAIFAAKARSYDKPCGLFGSPEMCREIHDLPPDRHEMARILAEEEKLPFSVVAPFRPSHRFLAPVDSFTLRNASKNRTMDMVVSGGPFVATLAERSFARGVAVFGSSANRSLHGSKYRLQDIEPEVRAAATIEFDYGLSRWATPEGLSSTIIDFADFSVVRVGHQFARLTEAFRRRFGVDIRAPA
jgi:tRNA A37 threonylcarbamoyladenosine synthetase subunit TsaC/SUA5/YrdC